MKKDKITFVDKNWSALNEFLQKKEYSKVFILLDTNTLEHCLPILSASLEFDYHVLEIEPGEASKDLEICAHLWHELTEQEIDRKALIINLGGGVVTDLGGFIAGIYKRGIEFIHVPTSLLGMVDASLGGKCGIDFLNHKNQLGLFQCAEEIFVFQGFLKTLPTEELRSGFAEMIKHALIFDRSYWEEVKGVKDITAGELHSLTEKSMLIKTAIVNLDPFEKADRKKLNFGHTIGHAIESYFLELNNPIPHGYAIAAGMFMEAYLSLENQFLQASEFEEISQFIAKHYQKLSIDDKALESILKRMKQDKKRKNNLSQFTLLSGIGESQVDQVCSDREVRAAFKYYESSYAN